MRLSSTRVYAIADPDELLAAEHGAEPSMPIREKKQWTAAARMLAGARGETVAFLLMRLTAHSPSEEGSNSRTGTKKPANSALQQAAADGRC